MYSYYFSSGKIVCLANLQVRALQLVARYLNKDGITGKIVNLCHLTPDFSPVMVEVLQNTGFIHVFGLIQASSSLIYAFVKLYANKKSILLVKRVD